MFVRSLIEPLISLFARGGGGGHGGGGHSGGLGGGGFDGGSYGGGSSSGGGFLGVIFFIIIIVVIAGVIIYIIRKRHRNPKVGVTPSDSVDMAASQGLTQEDFAKIFYDFQRDWSSGDSSSMQSYLSNRYHYDVGLMLAALQILGRQNRMEDVRLLKTSFMGNQSDAASVDSDTLIVEIQASAKDSLVDKSSEQIFYTDTAPFAEYWCFVQEENSWKLNNIRQTTEQENLLHPVIANFATANKFFYSGEWGNLLLPTRGQLFSQASFTSSAVNDHVVGLYKNVIIEFYTYLPNKAYSESYTIAQADLPKSYGNIIVHHKSGLLNMTPRGLTKVQMEWPDFNKKYDVYASDMERITSFELLNPSFMVKIEELPFEVNIEVVDNIIYLHTKQPLEDYGPMLDILYLAFQEMKM